MIMAIIKKGKVFGEDVPAPVVSEGSILIKVVNSCISAGTEMMGVHTSGKLLIKRAMEQPDNVRKVFNMVKAEGARSTYKKIKNKIEDGQPTGYSLSGVVVGVGKGVKANYQIGDKVAATGSGIANHAEYVDVPENLVLKMPDGLDFIEASTVALGSIAMQGVRRADLNLGEFAVVFGAGVLGLLCVQILRVSGIRVAAIDFDEKRLRTARETGAEICINPSKEDSVQKITNWSNGFGADAVIFAAATQDSKPLSQSFQMCRKKGRVALLGVVGMEMKREDMYLKEMDFLMSTSYGPGRYDKNYEAKGLDYPYAYVRWTENRMMGEYLRLINEGLIKLDLLISGIYSIEKVTEAFESFNVSENKPLMVFLTYDKSAEGELQADKPDKKVILNNHKQKKDLIHIALIGCGNFANGMHLLNIDKMSDKYQLHAVMDRTGHKAKAVGHRYKAVYVTTEYEEILNDGDVDLVMITTRHDSHADLSLKALNAGKNVFVEKPLAVNREQLEEIKSFFDDLENPPVLMVGFNRRFSRYALEIKRHTDKRVNPLFIHYRMNAGYVPLDHWVHENGGRIIGEGCHIIDLMSYLTGCRINSISHEEMTPKTGYFSSEDNKSIILKYEDGSLATVEYFANGNKSFSKEYMEVHFDGKTIVMDDYKSLRGFGVKINEISTRVSQKGHLEELERLYDTLAGKDPNWPIEFWDIIQTTEASLSFQK